MNAIYSDLENKIILVTGGNRGIGRGICESLAKQKAHVVFSYRSNDEEANELKKLLKDLGAPNATALKFDVTNFDEMKTTLEDFIKEFGPITGLVNNAGISKDGLILRNKAQDVEKILETNLKAPIVLTSLLSRSFLKGENVSIVNMSSIVGLMGNASQINYSASKAGLIGMTKSTAKELASRNIRCNVVCPGFIETEMTSELSDAAKEKYLESIPLSRFGQKNEVSELVAFLLSQSSSYITGEVFKIDGGLYI